MIKNKLQSVMRRSSNPWYIDRFDDELVVDKEIPYCFTVNKEKKWVGRCRESKHDGEYLIAFNFAYFPTDATVNDTIASLVHTELEELSHWGTNNRDVSDDHSDRWAKVLLQITAESIGLTIWSIGSDGGAGKKYKP